MTGKRIKTAMMLGSTDGMAIAQRHLDTRMPNCEGTVKGYVPGHGGDVWFVEHPDGAVAAYSITEMAELPETHS